MKIEVKDRTEPNYPVISEHSEYEGIFQVAFRAEPQERTDRAAYCLSCGKITEYYFCTAHEDHNGGDNNEIEDE